MPHHKILARFRLTASIYFVEKPLSPCEDQSTKLMSQTRKPSWLSRNY